MERKATIAELKRLISELAPSTASAMVLPTSITNDLASKLVEQLPLNTVVCDLAVILAKEVGNVLQQKALRPSDYADLNELPHMLIERLIDELANKPAEFFDTFAQHLKLKG